VDVPDLQRAIDFYTAAFQLSVGRRLGQSVVELLGSDAPLYLLEKPSETLPFADATSTRNYARHWTPVHLDFVVEKLEPALARAVAAGALVHGAISEHAWGRMVPLADPFGHGLCLIEFSGRGYDELLDG